MYSTGLLKTMYSTEQLLIVLLARLHFKTCDKAEVDNFLRGNTIDYDSLEKIVAVHGIRPFVFHVITAYEIDVDKSFMERLRTFYLYNNKRSIEQLVIASGIISALQQQGIDAVPFKGAGFAHNYYGDLALRESSDIDLFARKKDVEAIETVFKEKGYEPKVTVPSRYMHYYKTYFKEIVYSAAIKPGGDKYSVELHWKLVDLFFGSYPSYDFFGNAVCSQEINNIPFKKLAPSYELVAIVSNHFVKDMSQKFKYLVDVAAIINRCHAEIDVSLLTRTVQENGCRKRTEHGLFIIKQLLGVQLRGYDFAYSFKPGVIRNALSVPLYIRHFDVINLSFIRAAWSLQDSFAARLKFLQRCAFYHLLPTINDINKAPLKKRSIPVLALMRPFRLAGKALGVWRGKRKNVSGIRQ